jgi:hypothetical protein
MTLLETIVLRKGEPQICQIHSIVGGCLTHLDDLARKIVTLKGRWLADEIKMAIAPCTSARTI